MKKIMLLLAVSMLMFACSDTSGDADHTTGADSTETANTPETGDTQTGENETTDGEMTLGEELDSEEMLPGGMEETGEPALRQGETGSTTPLAKNARGTAWIMYNQDQPETGQNGAYYQFSDNGQGMISWETNEKGEWQHQHQISYSIEGDTMTISRVGARSRDVSEGVDDWKGWAVIRSIPLRIVFNKMSTTYMSGRDITNEENVEFKPAEKGTPWD